MTKNVKIIDTTLRDGSHAIHHSYTPEQVQSICIGLENAGVYAAEVGHGAGIGGSVLQYGLAKHDNLELFAAAKKSLKNTKLATLLVPGLGTMVDLQKAADAGLEMVRVATHCTEGDVGAQHIKLGNKLGLETVAFYMMTHMISPEELLKSAKLAEDNGAKIVYMADSAGAMTMDDVKARVEIIKANVSIPLGVHTHNNLGLGVGNAIAAVSAGADFVDTSLEGLGAGSGNGNAAAICAVLNKMKVDTGVDFYELVKAGKQYVRPVIQHSLEITGESVILGFSGIYSSFYLHVIEASERFNIDPAIIFRELAAKKVVGGQEDQILDICYKILGEG